MFFYLYRVLGNARGRCILGCSQTDFKHQLDHFNKELFTLVALDPRGYGKSIPPTRDWPEQFFRRDADDAVKLMEVR